MQPALSRDEAEQVVWAVINENDHGTYGTTRDLITDLMARLGFTWEDVRRHREQAKALSDLLALRAAESQIRAPSGQGILGWVSQDNELRDRIRWHESMADRIEALLPPED